MFRNFIIYHGKLYFQIKSARLYACVQNVRSTSCPDGLSFVGNLPCICHEKIHINFVQTTYYRFSSKCKHYKTRVTVLWTYLTLVYLQNFILITPYSMIIWLPYLLALILNLKVSVYNSTSKSSSYSTVSLTWWIGLPQL